MRRRVLGINRTENRVKLSSFLDSLSGYPRRGTRAAASDVGIPKDQTRVCKTPKICAIDGQWKTLEIRFPKVFCKTNVFCGDLCKDHRLIEVGALTWPAKHSALHVWIVSSVAVVVRPTGAGVEQPDCLPVRTGLGVPRPSPPNQKQCAPGCV
jgi:hypothetical protein